MQCSDCVDRAPAGIDSANSRANLLTVVGSSGSWRRLRSRRGLLVCGQDVGVAAATAGGLAAMASRNACSLV
jgi:hypothetical protein